MASGDDESELRAGNEKSFAVEQAIVPPESAMHGSQDDPESDASPMDEEMPKVETIETSISEETAEMASGDGNTYVCAGTDKSGVVEEPIPPFDLMTKNFKNELVSQMSRMREETNKSVFVQLELDELGGWNMKNSTKTLGKYLKKTGQQCAQYKTERTAEQNCTVSLSIFVSETGQNLSTTCSGEKMGIAEAKCATALIHELYRMKIVEEFEGPPRDTRANRRREKSAQDGGWNRKNSRQALAVFLLNTGQSTSIYKTKQWPSGKGVKYWSTASLFVPQTGETVTARCQAKKQSRAEGSCAQTIARKLYHMKILGAFGGWAEESKKSVEPKLPKEISEIDSDDDGDSETEIETSDFDENQPKSLPGVAGEKKLVQRSDNGKWNTGNSRKALEEYCEKSLLPCPVYKTEKANKSKKFVSSVSLFVPETGKRVTSEGDGAKTKTAAEANCAMVMARQLYRIGVLEKFQKNKLPKQKVKDRGGWNRENSTQALDEYLQKTGQQPVVYEKWTAIRKKDDIIFFFASASVFVPKIDSHVHGTGIVEKEENAEASCAVNIVRQLYQIGVLPKFQGMAEEKEGKPNKNLSAIPVSIPEDLVARVKNYVQSQGVTPVVPAPESASLSDPQSLILFSHRHFARFPTSKVSRPRCIPWSSPMPNWNTWMGCEIGLEPWASKTIAQMSRWIEKMEANKLLNEEVQRKRKKLPVAQYRQEVIDTVATNQVILIKGAPGCGKSTQVAQYLLESFLEAGRGAEFNAIVSQPKRIGAISLAERVAVERNEESVGRSVGYGVRFDSVSPCPYGSIFFCTVGVLLKKMQKGLRGVSHVIIDEIHERDINTDLVLIVLREMAKEYPNLRIILMSATVDTGMFSSYFGGCPVIEIKGRSHPVQRLFLEDVIIKLDYMPPELPKAQKKKNQSKQGDMDEEAKNLNILDWNACPRLREAMSRIDEDEIPYDLIEKILVDIDTKGEEGAILIFLPGWLEITTLIDQLTTHPIFGDASRFALLPLHSQLPGGDQRKVFYQFGKGVRKIILSTNIAESSVTIDDIVYVIDSCKLRETHHIASHNMLHFETVWASRSNLAQRSGRAGRIRPGYAYQLCSRARFEALDEHRTAEILRSPLTSAALTIKSLRLGSVGSFMAKAIEPPPPIAVDEAETELKGIGALDDNLELTKLGKIISRLPVDPIVGKAIVLGSSFGIGSLMCELAAASSFNSPFIHSSRKDPGLNLVQRSFAGNRFSDHAALIAVNQAFTEICEQETDEQEEKEFCKRYSLNAPILKITADAKNQLTRALVTRGFPITSIKADVNDLDKNLDLLTSLLVSAYYPNVAIHRGYRGVLTLDQSHAIISRMSVLAPGKKDVVNFPSPLVVFREKVKAGAIVCQELSLVSAVQLIIFGCRKLECIGHNLVRLDNTIILEMDVEAAAALVSLRPCADKHLIKACLHPESLQEQSDADRELISILLELSSSSLFA